MGFLTRWFNNTFNNIPQITNADGSLVAALDAMLVTGFNVKPVTALSQSAGIATCTFADTHGFVLHSVVRISGASPSGWNGDYRVTGVSGANVTFACDDTLSTASGTISVKFAPADWEIVYSATNKRVYRSSALDSTRCLLRVDDTTTTTALCSLYENMSDIDTGAESHSVYHYKRNSAANATYCLYSDDRLFYLFSDNDGSNSNWYGLLIFGDIVSYKAGDAYHCALAGQDGAYSHNYFSRISANASWCALARGTDGLPGYANFSLLTLNVSSEYLGNSSQTYPNPSTNGIHPVPVYVRCENDVRGVMPGIYHSANTIPRIQGTVFEVPGMGWVVRQLLQGGACYMSLGAWR